MTVLLSDSRVRRRWTAALEQAVPVRSGVVRRVTGMGFEVAGLDAAIGDMIVVEGRDGDLTGQVVGLRQGHVLASAFGELEGVRDGQRAVTPGGPPEVPVGMSMLGRVVDALGRPIDNQGELGLVKMVGLDVSAPTPLERRRISQAFPTGVKAIDTTISMGRGQRIGIFAGSGVGKSTLLSMIVKGSEADIVVIGLVGERGREVREFIERDLGADGLSRSVLVVATSDEPPMMRLAAARTATRIAEEYRDRGLNVLLLVDSITRFAMAQREVGLAAGEFPASRGYPASVLAMLPKLLERSGMSDKGSITAIYTVLVEGDDMNEPVADTVRSILDGHVVLSRHLAHRGHYPAIDVLASVSRVVGEVCSSEEMELATVLRSHLAAYEESRDLVEVGAYVSGTNPRTDAALQHIDSINGFLRQSSDTAVDRGEAFARLADAVGGQG